MSGSNTGFTAATTITLRKADTRDIPAIMNLAETIWWPTYSPIITKEQIRYMLDSIYSSVALRQVMEKSEQQFLLLLENEIPHGFAAFGMRAEDRAVYKLHKLYVLPEDHGKGYGKKLLDEVVRLVRENGGSTLDLNVNRHNQAKGFYERQGFRVLREEDIAIGPYWMNDFVMRKEL